MNSEMIGFPIIAVEAKWNKEMKIVMSRIIVMGKSNFLNLITTYLV